jgi:hypothetical protein
VLEFSLLAVVLKGAHDVPNLCIECPPYDPGPTCSSVEPIRGMLLLAPREVMAMVGEGMNKLKGEESSKVEEGRGN